MRRAKRRSLSIAAVAGLIAAVVGVLLWVTAATGTQPYQTYEERVTADAPVAQFRFDDPKLSSTIADSAGSYTATNHGIILEIEGPFEGSASGDLAGSEYATLPADPLEGAKEWTAEAWVYWVGGTSYKQPVFDFGSSSSNYIYLTPASSLTQHKMLLEMHTTSGASAQVTAPKLSANGWDYLAVTESSSGTLTLYENGEQVGQTTGASLSPASLGSTPTDYLGKSLVSGEPGFKGNISNVAFYTKALSASQIKTHWNGGEYPVNTALPAITGTARDGNTLTGKAGSWSGLSPITLFYRWQRCNSKGEACKPIESVTEPKYGTEAKYTTGHEDVGNTLRFAVTGTNAAGEGSATSEPSAVVQPAPPTNNVEPAISGEAKDGQVLSVSTGTWEGTPPIAYSYQWEACTTTKCKKITGATEASYRVISSEIGETLRATVTAENVAGSKNAKSPQTATIAAGRPVNESLPSVSGEPKDLQLLSSTLGTWAGTLPIEFSRQWQHCDSNGQNCENIEGATGTSLSLTSVFVGDTIRVVVTATNAQGPTSAASKPTGVVTAIPPSNTAAPSVEGEAKDGKTLHAGTGSWYGSAPISYAYQWEECDSTGKGCKGIGGATEPAYTIPHGNVGATLRVDVTARNAGGSAEHASATTAVVAAEAPAETAKPTISGTPEDGSPLTASSGEWKGTPTISYAYQWESCDAHGEHCEAIGGATSSAYAPSHQDVGLTLRVVVTATNAGGSVPGSSEPTAVVAASPPANATAPSIEGDAREGEVLKALAGEWTGTPAIAFSYQWEACDALGESCLPIPGATQAAYTPTSEDVGAKLRLAVTAANARSERTAYSAPSAIVAGELPANTAAPSISGEALEGATLNVNHGTWTGTTPITYVITWLRCDAAGSNCAAVEGASGPSYKLLAGDVGHRIEAEVLASNAAGSSSASSAATAAVAGSSCQDTWTGAAGDGLWQTAGNWSSGEVPGSATSACIPAGATATVNEGSRHASELDGEGSVTIVGGSLELTGGEPSTLASLALAEGTLNGSATLKITSSLTLRDSAVMSGTGALVIAPGANALIEAESGCNPLVLSRRTLVNEGTLDYAWGTLQMSDGAILENRGTIQYDNSSGCFEPQIMVGEESSAPPAIVNTGKFARTTEPAGGVGVPFTNDGTVESQHGRLELSGGGVPEEVASGVWETSEEGRIALTAGTFLIGEEVDLSHVEVDGATIERASSGAGLHGHMNARAFAAGTVTLSGLGRGAGFDSATIEVAPQGGSEWHSLCGPLTPNFNGEFECAWSTAGSSYPDGSYQLRAELSDGADTATTETITILVDNTPPTGSVSAPATLEGHEQVTGTADDSGSGVASWQLQIAHEGSGEWANACPVQGTPERGDTYSCEVKSRFYPNGNYELRAIVTDNAGNSYTTAAGPTAIANSASGCTDSWTGTAGDGLWQTAANWSSGSVPGEEDSVCIPAGAAVTISAGNQQAGEVDGEGSLTIDGGSLELLDTVHPSTLASLSVQEGSLSGPGSLKLTSALNLYGNAALTGTGSLVIEAGASALIEPSSGCEPIELSQRTLVNEGTLDYSWGTLEMSDGAVLQNAGTLEYDTSSGCYEPQIRTGEESSGPPAIVNTGRFERANPGTGGVGVPFTNDGTVEARQGRLEFSGGGVPDEAATGAWATSEEGQIALTAGTFLIGEEVDLSQVEIDGATVERGSGGTGLRGSLASHQYAAGTVTLTGVGHGSGFSAASIEVMRGASGEWQSLCGPLTPSVSGEFECTWDTGGGAYPDGSYRLRAQLSDGTSTVATEPITVLVDNTPPEGGVSAPSTLEGDASISGTASDATSGVAAWQLQIAPQGSSEWTEACPAQTHAASGDTYECTIETSSFPNGSYQLRALIADNAGNVFTTTVADATIENEPPSNTTSPTISGPARRGRLLTAGPGAWAGSRPLTYTYQWQRCDENGESCVAVEGATGSTYRVGDADSDATLRVEVTAKNGVGQASAASAHTSPVAGPDCTTIWTGGAGGSSWSTPGNWSTGRVPGADDAACIEQGASVRITSTGSTAGELDDEGELYISGGSLELTRGSSTVEALTIDSGALSGPGSLTVERSLWLEEGASLSGGGELVIAPSASATLYAFSRFGASQISVSGYKLTNEGTLDFVWGRLLMAEGANIENDGVFELDTEAARPQIRAAGEGTPPFIRNYGTFEKTSGTGTATVEVPFSNQGSVSAVTGTLEFTAGGIPGETAYGTWRTTSPGAIALTGGTFPISEDVDLSEVHVEGATVETVADAGAPSSQHIPSIAGGTKVGDTLSATNGTWAGAGPLSYGYQWERCDRAAEHCAPIEGATSATYVLSPADDGSRVRIAVTAENSEGRGTAESRPTSPIVYPPIDVTLPGVSGVAQVGQTLTAQPGSWEANSPLNYSYQWQLCEERAVTDIVRLSSAVRPMAQPNRTCNDISGATQSTYTPQDKDVEDTLRVIVTAEDGDGETSATSPESEEVIPAAAPESTSPPTISGTPQEGQALQGGAGGWSSPGEIGYALQWERCDATSDACTKIEGATGADYTPGIPDLGDTLRLTVTAANLAGSASATSEATGAITQAPPPTVVEAPTVSGSPKAGQTLTVSNGSWESPFPLTYSYQWERCSGGGTESCSDIAGANSAGYTLTSSEPSGSSFRATVTATNIYEASATSASATRYLPSAVRVTEYSYDADGNLASQTDGNGHTTTYEYGPGDERTKATEPDGSTTETGYNADGQVTSQTDGNGHTTKYVRDVLGQVSETTDPLGRKTVKEYDGAGNLTSVRDAAGRTTTYSYDAANRPIETAYSDGTTPTVKYEYDADGNRTKMTDGTGTSTYTFDQLDRLTQSTDGHGATVGYEYDLAGNQTKTDYPGEKPVEREYDEDGRVASVKDWLGNLFGFAYDPDSDLTTIAFPSESKESDHYTYDDADQMSGANFAKGSESLASLSYARDSEGQIRQTVSSGLPGEATTDYGYDQDNRLTKEGSTEFKYDAAGDPTQIGASTNAYDAANELEHSSGASYSYNQMGERTQTTPSSGPATSYGYDQAGNLTSVTRPEEGATGALEDSYSYNGEGLRTGHTTSAGSSAMTWDTAEALPLLLTDASTAYVYGPNGPVEQVDLDNGTVTYLHHDQQGSTRVLSDREGEADGRCSYSAYGGETCEGPGSSKLGYDAQYTDSDTGLSYLRHRSYDPLTAQFTSPDPIASSTREPFTYVGDSPLNGADPTGLFSIGEIPIIGGTLEKGATRFVGFWDGLTRPFFGGTAALRSGLGLNGGLNECSSEYQLASEIGGYTFDAEAVASAAYGGWRIAAPVFGAIGSEGTVAATGNLFTDIATSLPDADLYKLTSVLATVGGSGFLGYEGAQALQPGSSGSTCGCS